MATKKELVERRAERAKGYRDLIDNAEKEDRGLTKEEDEKIVALQKEMGDLDARIQRAEEKEKEEKRAANLDDLQKRSDGIGGDAVEVERRNAFIQALRDGVSSLSAEQRSHVIFETRTGQVTTTPSAGGYLVSKTLSDKVIVALKAKGGFLAAADVITTSTGGDLILPIFNDTSAKATIIGEGVTTEKGNKTFDTKTLKAYTYRSLLIPVSFELLQDSEFDIVGLLADAIAESIYRGINEHFTTGDGTGKPAGLLSSTTKGADAAAGAITNDNLLDLIGSIDPSYLVSASWMMNNLTIIAIRKLKDTTGRPLWEPSLQAGQPGLLLGYPVILNPDMPNIGTGTKSVVFGDLKQYKIRQVSAIRIIRLDERLADEGNVGFLGFARFDGLYANAGTNPIKHLLHA